MGTSDEYPPQIRAILERVADAGNHFVVTSMAASTDPAVREIGEQFHDGASDLDQLARSDSYRQVLDAGLENLSRLEPDWMTADLDAALTARVTPKPGTSMRTTTTVAATTGSRMARRPSSQGPDTG